MMMVSEIQDVAAPNAVDPGVLSVALDAPDAFSISIPARTYTGDFYMVRRIGDATWFAVGDVAGKGAQAAIWMAMIQEELDRHFTPPRPEREACGIVRAIDAMLREELPPNRFATLVVGRVERDGTVVIANGGHPSPLIRRRGGAVEEIPANGPAVGILPNRCWGSTTHHLEPGDALILFTDGAVEARNRDADELGMEGVSALVAMAPAGPAQRLAHAVLDGIHRWTGGAADDDLTLLALSRPAGGTR